VLDLIRIVVALTAVTFAAGFAIALTHSKTAERIAIQQQKAEQDALLSVFPEGVEIAEKKAAPPLPSRYWEATKGGACIGYAFQGSSKGFEKDIKIVVAVNTVGTILGMNVLSQSETPGLGSRVQEIASTKYIWNAFSKKKEESCAWFAAQFSGLNAMKGISINDKFAEWHALDSNARKKLQEENAITAITGATISTKAVIKAAAGNIPKYLAQLTTAQEAQ
jgi:electron transport complex protein RnfG